MIPPDFKAPKFFCRQNAWLMIVLVVLAFILAVAMGRSESAHAAGPAQRIVSVGPALTEMLYALELEARVVGVSSYCNYPARVKTKPVVGDALNLNEERLISLRPDLIVTVEGGQGRLARLAKLTGARLQVLPTRHVADIWSNMRTLGALTGREAKAQALSKSLQAKLSATAKAAKMKPQRVFYMVWDKPLMAAGSDSYLNDLVSLAGARNIVTPGTPGGSYPPYSWEALLAANPDVILGPENLAPALKGLAGRYPGLGAVKTGRVRTLPDDLISRPGPRVVEALAAVVKALK